MSFAEVQGVYNRGEVRLRRYQADKSKWTGDRVADNAFLRSINFPRVFADQRMDELLAKLSEYDMAASHAEERDTGKVRITEMEVRL